jgi:hypothetical protein
MPAANHIRRSAPRQAAKIARKKRPARKHWLTSFSGTIEIVVCVGHIAAAATLVLEHFL